MRAEPGPAYAAPLPDLRSDNSERASAPCADLPRSVIDVLRQRGIEHGPVLVLLDRSPPLAAPQGPPRFQVTWGLIRDATQLARAGFVAVVLILEAPQVQPPEAILAGIAARIPTGVVLVLLMPSSSADLAATHRGPALQRKVDPRETAHLMLLRAGYDRVWVHKHSRTLCVSARCAPLRPRACSIIVPVYNEKATLPRLMQALLAKRLTHLGLEREILIVESHSTDGSRELVANLAGTPGVRILWQDRPRGKGHAVREGLRAATGDIVLIQDADLEYDVNDYDALLEPLLEDRAAFVLGSRHSGQAAMRVFADEQKLLGHICNLGHIGFRALINILYAQSIRDPFTMFKVFRRDCLHGLDLECNRFDFDHELLIKLVLKGYRPLEIPVHYRSRSFKQGKKIRFFRDPLTWLLADLKYRVEPLRPNLD
jgi:hypothetical protein